jgi:carboxyl-terminal processing protease
MDNEKEAAGPTGAANKSGKLFSVFLLLLLWSFLFSILTGNSPSFVRAIISPSPSAAPSSTIPDVSPLQNPGESDFRIDSSVKPPDEYSLYHPYLTGKKKLEFTPSIDLCQSVLFKIQNEYVDEVSPQVLFGGVRDEVGMLLSDWNIDQAPLKTIPLTKDIFSAVIKSYSPRVDERLLLYACINGLIKSLNDPYCDFLPPREYQAFVEKTKEAQYFGIGVRIVREPSKSQLKIIEVFNGSPAHLAGIKENDLIVKIEGHSTRAMTLNQASQKIKGPENTRIQLTVKRKNREIDFFVIRKNIVLHTVHSKMLERGIGYVKVDGFREEVADEFRQAFRTLEDKGAKALIMDLRNNPGGLVRSAQSLCGCFLERNALVSTFRHRNNGSRAVRATGRRIVFMPVVLLVNENSASSAEITAGALRDHGVAVLIGTRTRGKGSVQRTAQLRDGAAVKLTIEKIFTPNGFSINKYGITPDIKAGESPGFSLGGGDLQLDAARKYLEGKIPLPAPSVKKSPRPAPSRPPREILDRVLP